ncbi:MAG: TolC family protein [Bacillota bacterium]
MELTFSKAVKVGLDRNDSILKKKEKVASLQRKLAEIGSRDDWEWDLDVEGRAVSDNTRTTSRKKMAALELKKTFAQGLNINPKFYLKEQEILEDGLSRDSINLDISLEQQIYPLQLEKNDKYYLKTKIRLAKAQAKLWQERQQKLVEWWADYLQLIELKIEVELDKRGYQIQQRKLEQVKTAYQAQASEEEDLIQAKINLKKEQRYWEKTKNKYQQLYHELKQELGLTSEEEVAVLTSKEFDLESVANLEVDLPDLEEEEKLLELATENSKDLLIQQLEKKQVLREEEWQSKSEQPSVDLMADYDYNSQQWQVAVNITDQLFSGSTDKLAREELEQDLEQLKREKDDLLDELNQEIAELVGEITVNQLKVAEEELEVKKAKLEVKQSREELAEQEISQIEHDEELLDLKEAKLDWKQSKHDLLVSKYELIKLLGILKF